MLKSDSPPCSDNCVVIYNGLAQNIVYTCYLDVGTVYNRSYINCTSARLPQSPSTYRSPVYPASRISIKATVKNLTFLKLQVFHIHGSHYLLAPFKSNALNWMVPFVLGPWPARWSFGVDRLYVYAVRGSAIHSIPYKFQFLNLNAVYKL